MTFFLYISLIISYAEIPKFPKLKLKLEIETFNSQNIEFTMACLMYFYRNDVKDDIFGTFEDCSGKNIACHEYKREINYLCVKLRPASCNIREILQLQSHSDFRWPCLLSIQKLRGYFELPKAINPIWHSGGGGHDGLPNVLDHCAQTLRSGKLKLGGF